MIRQADRDRQWLARTLLVTSLVSVLLSSTENARAFESHSIDAQDDPAPLKREAPVFTYRQFTSRLPPLPSAFPDTASTEPSLDVGSAEAVLPVSDDLPSRRLAGLMGRFGRGVDAISARDGISAGRAGQTQSTAHEPETTATVADLRAAPPREAPVATNRLIGTGRASWYQHPGRTANGETYDPNRLTAAHHSLPFGTKIKVVNKRNGRSVVVRITDRTNERTKARRSYAIDLSRASARQLGIAGIGLVALYTVD